MLSHFLLRCLHRFGPERAHSVVVFLLKIYQTVLRWIPGKWYVKSFPIPHIQIARLTPLLFSNRLGLAAGFDKNAEVFPALSRMGFGFIEVGTVTPLPQPGNPQPRIWRASDRQLVNSLGFNNVGLAHFAKHIRRLRKFSQCPVLANIGKGRDTALQSALQDYQSGFSALENLVDGFVVNVSSPNTPQLFKLQTSEFVQGLTRIAPQGIPVFIKLSPDLSNADLTELCRMIAGEARLSGIVLTNTSRSLAEKAGYERGGLSGPGLFPDPWSVSGSPRRS